MAKGRESWQRLYFPMGSIAFWAIHVAAVVGVFLVGFSWFGLALAAIGYVVRMFFVTAGYHRYFAHRSYRTSRWFQFVLGFCAQTTAQRSVLWWAAHHRHHHRYSDTVNDTHSPVKDGFWWAHVGWTTADSSNDVDYTTVKDLSKYPELRLLDRFPHTPALILSVVLSLVFGWTGLVWGFLVSTVVLWHGTFTINSLSHLFGSRRYATPDDSRNNFLLALITLGEGWHNNHHHYMTSANQGFRWWEVDVSFYVLRAFSAVGLVWGLRRPPAHVLAAGLGARTGDDDDVRVPAPSALPADQPSA